MQKTKTMGSKWNTMVNFVFMSACIVLVCAQDVTYHINEELPNSTLIGNVMNNSNLFSAIGGSSSASLTFFTTETEYSRFFRVDEKNSNLYTNGIIDREVICEFSEVCMLELQIVAKSTLGSFFHILKIHIFINDVNDHSPAFSRQSLTISISESVLIGKSIEIAGARDKDTSAEFSLKQYQMKPRTAGEDLPFSINFVKHLDGSSVVRLFVIKGLDRETKDTYTFDIIAEDGDEPPRQGKLSVTLRVSDINDNAPSFSAQTYNCTVNDQATINTVIIKMNATDPDSLDNGLIKYKLSSHQSAEIFSNFQINDSTGEISLKQQLVFSPGKIFFIIVEAYDNPIDGQSLSTQAIVRVTVQNSGNNPPVIQIKLLSQKDTAEVPENASIGNVVAFVVVVDHDVGQQSIATCIIVASDFDIQRIDMSSYKVFVSRQLDYERSRSQNVTIHCQDNGARPLSTSASFTINILDINDQTPKFTEQFYSTNVREDTSVGVSILEVSASDEDAGNNSLVDFEVADGFKDVFYIERSAKRENTGVLRVGKPLDREIKSSFLFQIYAKDRGTPQRTGTATISLQITDVNDERPNFTQMPFEFYVLENLLANADVGRVTAIDKDLGMNAQVEFKMHPDFEGKVPFVVFADGKIKTNHDLDREEISRYDFKVIATDKGSSPLSNTGSVVVKVSDANDHAPEISFPKLGNNTVYVPHSVQAWHIVTRVMAKDRDEINTGNSKLRFSIEGRNDSNLFQINPNTGEIQITGPLQPADVGKIFRLELFVSDYGQPKPQAAETVMYIMITSENATMAAAQTDLLSNKNVLIAIIVGVVTVVLSVGLVAVICVIRKIDRERKLEQQMKNNNQITVDPDINGRQVFDGSITVFSLPSEDSLIEKKKKEVSFSLEDDVFSDDDLIQKSALENGHRHYKGNHSFLTPGPKKVEDNHSETSGDTGTSDSGRGGSDEEMQTSMSQSPREKMMDFTRPLPPMSHQEIIPFSFKKGLSTPFRDFSRPVGFSHERGKDIEMKSHDHDRHRPVLSTMAVHTPTDSLDRSRNKVVLLQTDSGIHSDTNSTEGDNHIRDCMV